MVFCDFYPVGDTQFDELRDAIDRLHLNDASFNYQPTSSEALGFGFRCGFLGMLHMDIIQERPGNWRGKRRDRPDRPHRHLRNPHERRHGPPDH